MCEDFIFGKIDNFNVKVLKSDVDLFKSVINDDSVPKTFVMESYEAIYLVNKTEKTIRIFDRKYKNKKKEDVDLSVYVVSQIATKCGFTIFLDIKYSN